MFKISKEKLNKNEKYLKYLRENSNYYKYFNREEDYYEKFVDLMKDKYKLRTLDRIDNTLDSIDLITKIIKTSNSK